MIIIFMYQIVNSQKTLARKAAAFFTETVVKLEFQSAEHAAEKISY
jgi:hypothetical protein